MGSNLTAHEKVVLAHWPPSLTQGWKIIQGGRCKDCGGPALRHPRFEKYIGCAQCQMFSDHADAYFELMPEPPQTAC